mmetsp:Transcript_48980/g.118613  ORF Transcript_48980/g.118613 Transcript_48980/m.118613 type:complete len:205 (+) Transcript_48980:1067-1681(+)
MILTGLPSLLLLLVFPLPYHIRFMSPADVVGVGGGTPSTSFWTVNFRPVGFIPSIPTICPGNNECPSLLLGFALPSSLNCLMSTLILAPPDVDRLPSNTILVSFNRPSCASLQTRPIHVTPSCRGIFTSPNVDLNVLVEAAVAFDVAVGAPLSMLFSSSPPSSICIIRRSKSSSQPSSNIASSSVLMLCPVTISCLILVKCFSS